MTSPDKVLSIRMPRDVADRLQLSAVLASEPQGTIVVRMLDAFLPTMQTLTTQFAARYTSPDAETAG